MFLQGGTAAPFQAIVLERATRGKHQLGISPFSPTYFNGSIADPRVYDNTAPTLEQVPP